MAVENASVGVESSSQVFAIQKAIKDILADEYPPEEREQRAPWMIFGTYVLCKQRRRQWNLLNRMGRQLANAICWFVCKWWTYMAKVARVEYRPKWNHTRGPATKQLCMRRYQEQNLLASMSKNVDVATAKDFADHAARRGKELVDATNNNDAQLVQECYADVPGEVA